MMRTTWNGSISFSLVSIPVGLAPATKAAARQSEVSFRMLHAECRTPIKQKRWCPFHEREVSPEEIVKGWEVSKGAFVVVEDAELEAIARFVPVGSVDPIYLDRTYFLVPAAQAAARRPYVLLLAAMRETGMAAIGRFVQAGKEKLCLIRPKGEALALETLFLTEDVYSQAEIDEAVSETEVKDAELGLARQLIESLVGGFKPEELTGEYRRDLRALLEAKLAGGEIAHPEPLPEAPVVDLIEALRRSVAEAAKRKASGSKTTKTKAAAPAKRRAPARPQQGSGR